MVRILRVDVVGGQERRFLKLPEYLCGELVEFFSPIKVGNPQAPILGRHVEYLKLEYLPTLGTPG